MTKQRVNNGAIAAILDEYEKSINELIVIVKDISSSVLIETIDFETKDEDCKSIQSVLTHVVHSGYTYIVEIRKWLGEDISYQNKLILSSANEYTTALKTMYEFNKKLFIDYPHLTLCENNSNKKINVRWGQKYDVEQLLEHAIVHILRHRRQIEIFILKKDLRKP